MDYADVDDKTLQDLHDTCDSYEERCRIRAVIRQRRRQRGPTNTTTQPTTGTTTQPTTDTTTQSTTGTTTQCGSSATCEQNLDNTVGKRNEINVRDNRTSRLTQKFGDTVTDKGTDKGTHIVTGKEIDKGTEKTEKTDFGKDDKKITSVRNTAKTALDKTDTKGNATIVSDSTIVINTGTSNVDTSSSRGHDVNTLTNNQSGSARRLRPKKSAFENGDTRPSPNKYEKIKDEDALRKLLQETDNLDDKLFIRAALRKLKKQQTNGPCMNTDENTHRVTLTLTPVSVPAVNVSETEVLNNNIGAGSRNSQQTSRTKEISKEKVCVSQEVDKESCVKRSRWRQEGKENRPTISMPRESAPDLTSPKVEKWSLRMPNLGCITPEKDRVREKMSDESDSSEAFVNSESVTNDADVTNVVTDDTDVITDQVSPLPEDTDTGSHAAALANLKKELKELEKKFSTTKDFEARKETRAEIKHVRALLKELEGNSESDPLTTRVASTTEQIVTLPDGTERHVTSKRSCYVTPSESDVAEVNEEKRTTLIADDGTEYHEQTCKIESQRVTRQGSLHTNTDTKVSYQLRTASGSMYEEEDAVSKHNRQPAVVRQRTGSVDRVEEEVPAAMRSTLLITSNTDSQTAGAADETSSNSSELSPPQFLICLSDMSCSIGSDICIQCQLCDGTMASVTWRHNASPVTNGSQTFDGSLACLRLPCVGHCDGGTYECLARNEAGEASTGCVLTVTEVKTQMLHSVKEEPETETHRNGKLDHTDQESSTAAPQTSCARMADTATASKIDSLDDEELLHQMLNQTENFDERRKIRARLREVREQKSAEWSQRRQTREESRKDVVKMRQEKADRDKARRMHEFAEKAREPKKELGVVEESLRRKVRESEEQKRKTIEDFTEKGKLMSTVYHAGADRATRGAIEKADMSKEAKLQDFEEEAVKRTTSTEHGADGSTTSTTVTTTTQRSKDGTTTQVRQTKQVTKIGGIGGTAYGVKNAGTGRGGAMAAFKQMDAASNPSAGRPNFLGGGGGKGVQRSASTIKQMLLDWTRAMTAGYENVNITNFSSSWNDGMAFCALIHHFFPDKFQFSKLNPKARRFNFTLAFDCAEKCAGIAPLLDVDDMVRMKNPDWKCVFTYVQSFYRWYRTQQDSKVEASPEQ